MGLVLEDKGSIYLVVNPTNKTKLDLSGDAEALRNLLGCKVKVGGRMTFGSLKVEGYEVIDAGYGSRPHVGVLQYHADGLRVYDVNSGALLELVGDKADGLWDFEGATVLVNGVIVGPHRVRVMSYRILLPNDRGKVAPPG